MKPIPQAAIWSALSFLLCMQLAAAISVYYFDAYEPAWGRGGSFRVLSAVVMLVSVIVAELSVVGLSLREHVNLSRPGIAGSLLGLGISACVMLFLRVNPKIPDNNIMLLICGFSALVIGLAQVPGLYGGKATS